MYSVTVAAERIHRDERLTALTEAHPVERVLGELYNSIRNAKFISNACVFYEAPSLAFFGHPIGQLKEDENYRLVGLFCELTIAAAKLDEWVGLYHPNSYEYAPYYECGQVPKELYQATNQNYLRTGRDGEKIWIAPEQKLIDLIMQRSPRLLPIQ